MKKTVSLILFVSLFLAACGSSSTPVTQPPASADVPTKIPPTTIPDTPAPIGIEAPLIESPDLYNIRMLDESQGWGVTQTQIARTDDGGATWHNVTMQGITELGYYVTAQYFLNASNAWVQVMKNGDPMQQILYRTVDGGITWTEIPVTFLGGSMIFLDENNGWNMEYLGVAAGSMGISIHQTTDGGQTWTKTYTNDPNITGAGDSLPLGGLKNNIAAINMQTAWVGGVIHANGTVYLYRTDDGGHTWSQVALPATENAQQAELSIDHIQFVTPTTGYIAMRVNANESRDAIYVTKNGGGTWTLTPTLISNAGSADFLSETEAIVFNGDQFFVTRDACQTWMIIPPNISFNDSFSSMDFVNVNIGWVIMVDSANHHSLYKTTDGGAVWNVLVP